MSDDQPLPPAPPLSGYEVPTAARTAPPPVRVAAVGVLVLALVNLADIVAVLTSRSRVADQLRAAPGNRLTGSQIDTVATASVVVNAAIAVALTALLVWTGIKILSGRNWARVTITVVLVLGVLSSAYTLTRPADGAWLLALEAVSDVLSVLVLVFLWGPAVARRHFAKRAA